MKKTGLAAFLLAFIAGFLVLLSVYTLWLFDQVMPRGETYVDENTGITISLPGGWIQSATLESGITVFEKGKTDYATYSWLDIWANDNMDCTRAEVNNSYFSEQQIQELCGEGTLPVAIGGTEYYLWVSGNDGQRLLKAFCFHDGIGVPVHHSC